MKLPCGCCEGTEVLTPLPTANRPGLKRLCYRVGTHAEFLESMKARLSGSDHPELSSLRTRESADFSIALLDAWATLADVLTFYQERIANEGYLRTATERRSISELAGLVGYKLRPGVASSVYLAYTMEKGPAAIPAGERAQSIPMPGEKLQSFETSEPLLAGSEWNAIKPRMTRPTKLNVQNAYTIDLIYIQGTSTRLKPNDPLLFVFSDEEGDQVLRWVKEVTPQKAENKTKVTLHVQLKNPDILLKAVKLVANRYLRLKSALCISEHALLANNVESITKNLINFPNFDINTLTSSLDDLNLIPVADLKASNANMQMWISGLIRDLQHINETFADSSPSGTLPGKGLQPDISRLLSLVGPISKPPLMQPANGLRMTRVHSQSFDVKKDTIPQLLTTFKPLIAQDIYSAWSGAKATETSRPQVYAFRVKASPFGNNAPKKILKIDDSGEITETCEWPIVEKKNSTSIQHEDVNKIYLEGSYENISPGSWIVVDTSSVAANNANNDNKNVYPAVSPILISKAESVQAGISRADYNINGKATHIQLSVDWIAFNQNPINRTEITDVDFQIIRRTIFYAQSELMTLTEEPVKEDICGKNIELGTLFPGLDSGRWVIVSGERIIPNTHGVKAAELVMLANVEHSLDESGVHSTLSLDKGLAYTYKRDTVTIYANIVKATHGETKREVLGSGDASAAFQQFALSQAPLTYLSAATPAGAESTLQVRVNGILWHEAESLFDLGPRDRGYITKTGDAGKTAVIFGNGVHGSRLPTGVENVTAVYRAGIGRPGNVNAGQIRLLATRPPGAKAVSNPLRSSGGADREGSDQGRRNAPLATMALDRLVSVEDYAFFARTYAGIAKARAASLSNGQRQLVHLTIAGSDDIPIDSSSDLLRNLNQALHRFGDPFQPVQIDVRELMLLIISANVRILPDYQWEKVEPQIRSALLDAFGFDRRELGQSAFLSEAVSVISQVEGVDYVEMVVFDSVSENVKAEELEKLSSSLGRKDSIKVELAGLRLKYVFSWTDIQKNNLIEFNEFLKQELDIGWADSITITSITVNNNPIQFSANDGDISHSLALELNSDKTVAILNIDGIKTAKFISKTEGEQKKINIYKNKILPAQLAYLSPDMRETLILNPQELTL